MMERINWIYRSRTSCWIFWEKIIKKSNIQELCQALKIIGEAISSYIISFQFPDTSEKPKIKWFEA